MNNVILYLLLGVCMNALYDLSISYIKQEELRFKMAERIVFLIVWPLYVLLLIINFIRNNKNESDE